jgi:glyoxylate reductase
MALLLGAARRLGEGSTLIREGKWRGWEPDQLLGLDLDGAKLGIVGLGRIGRAVAARARGFGMEVVHTGREDGLPLDELCAVSDVVSLHCPLTAATRHLIGAPELALMKPTAILVNTARGAIVDEAALAAALAAGRPGFAALDVFEEEPRVHPALVENRRALLLPHLGSATRGARARMAETAARSIADFLDGRRPANLVNPQALAASGTDDSAK